MRWSPFRSTGRAGLIACALSVGLWTVPARGQEPGPLTPTEDAPAHFDPSDVYFQGWLLSRDAEKLKAEKRYAEALEKFRRSQQLFDSVQKYFPLWKPEMVKGRQAQTLDFIAEVGPAALKEQAEAEQNEAHAIAELEGGLRTGVVDGEEPVPMAGSLPDAPIQPIQEIETLETRRIAELEGRVKELEQDLFNSGNPNAADRNASRARDLATQRDLARAELKRAQDELRNLRGRFAAEPMQQDLRKLSGQLQQLEREKAAVSQALERSQQETRSARAEADALQAERVRLAQKAADLERSLEEERKTQNQVIASQQKQLRELQDKLRGKNDELAQASQKIAALETQLQVVRSDFDELRQERDDLLREKEQMSALLKLNENGQIQQLIDQNMGLAKQLREATEQVERLNKNNNATQDELVETIRNLAIAKININAFKAEKAAQEKRMAELERRLRTEAGNLANAGGDPGEADMLRAIIQKQLRVQERRRKSAELLVDAVGEKAKTDEKIREALALFQGEELVLSPDEMEIVRNQNVDDEFVSPFRRPRDEVNASVAALERENLPYTDAAKRAFVKGSYLSCRELFELVLERHPGDTDTMCRLGIVQLKLENPAEAAQIFSDAVAINGDNPYAHRMLGYSLMEMQDYGPALEALKRSVELAPTNADGRVLLGALLFDLGHEEKAEMEFKSAIEFNDAMPQAHRNLAVLYAKQGKKKQGREYYQNSLERDALPDFDLEKRLGN